MHPGASFTDLTYRDFVASANEVAPILARSAELGVGRAIHDAIDVTFAVTERNTNLGILLLLAPLAAVPIGVPLQTGIQAVLRSLNHCDAELVYQAIRTADPGGMGHVNEQDLDDSPTGTLLEVMRLAAHRDQVANQYATNFQLVLEFGLPFLASCHDFSDSWENSIIGLHLQLMATYPDTLIARKCGQREADESASRAGVVLESGWPRELGTNTQFAELDDWLRAKDNQRNPGTTADLVTASLFAALRDGIIEAPAEDRIAEHAVRIACVS